MSNTGFTVILNETIINTKISDGAFRVLSFLTSMCYENKETCYPSQQYIATQLGKSTRQVQRKIKELKEAGLIQIRRRGSVSNVYTIMQKVTKNIHSKVKETVNSIKESINKKKPKKHSPQWDYESQRGSEYYTSLEEKLLGWDSVIQEDIAGEKFQQQIIT